MYRRLLRGGCLLGLAVLGAVFVAGGPVRAGSLVVGGGGIVKVGDPFYQYVIEVYLEPGYQIYGGSIGTADNFTIHQMPAVSDGSNGYTPPSLTSQPGGSPSGPWTPQITFDSHGPFPGSNPPFDVPISDVTWYNSGPNIAAGTSEVYLGEFRVQTWQPIPFIIAPFSLTFHWSANVHDANGNPVSDPGGDFTLTLLPIPEPASTTMLACGLGLPAVLWLRRRKRPGTSGE
jgi:hypothetical protein